MEDGKNNMENLKVIYEDNHIIVVEKPANIPSQQDKTNDIDMITIIKKYLKEKYSKPGEVYLGLIHRLDRPTGGVMCFAKTSKAAARLSEQIRNKDFEKTYLAVANGKFESETGVYEDYLLKIEKTNTSKVVEKNKKNAKYAKLEYEVLKYNSNTNLSVIKVKLDTGRHHQIRVQLASRNHSIYGDQKYGSRGKQLALWAYTLKLIHPISEKEMIFKSIPEPEKNFSELKDIMSIL